VLSAVHAGGEQGWESGHLEPFLFCRTGALGVIADLRGAFTPDFFSLESAFETHWVKRAAVWKPVEFGTCGDHR
jgi:hypothetical protein